jgi:hypothetical protein
MSNQEEAHDHDLDAELRAMLSSREQEDYEAAICSAGALPDAEVIASLFASAS